MSSDVTIGFLKRLSEGTTGLLAGQDKYDVEITGGEISNVTLTDVTLSLASALPVASGGTGATSASAARTSLGLAIGSDVQAYDATLAGIASQTVAINRILYTTAEDTFSTSEITGFGRSLIADSNSTEGRATLGLGSLAEQNTINNDDWSGTDLSVANGGTGASTLTGIVKGNGASAFSAASEGTDYYAPGGTDVAVADGGTGASDASGARTNFGLVIGTDVQAYDADLAALAGLTSAANKVPYFTGSEAAGVLDFLDEDNMSSDSATAVASQQSIKAYVDASSQGTYATKQATTSGSSINFTSIPSGVNKITIILSAVSADGTAAIRVQIGDSGGLETSGYLGSVTGNAGGSGTGGSNLSSGFDLFDSIVAGS